MRVVRFLQGCTYWQLPREEWESQFTGTRHPSLQVFVHWVYSGKLRGFYYPKTLKPTLRELSTAVLHELTRLCLEDVESLPLRNPAGRAFNIARYRDAPFSDLIALYILADTLQVHNLREPTVTRIIDIYGFSGSTERDSNDDKEGGKKQEG